MVDMHLHAVPPNLSGVGSLGDVLDLPICQCAERLRDETRDDIKVALVGNRG